MDAELLRGWLLCAILVAFGDLQCQHAFDQGFAEGSRAPVPCRQVCACEHGLRHEQ